MKKRHIQKLLVLSLALWALFNIPLVLLVQSTASFLGFPMFYVYLFSIWLGSIIVSFIIINKNNEQFRILNYCFDLSGFSFSDCPVGRTQRKFKMDKQSVCVFVISCGILHGLDLLRKYRCCCRVRIELPSDIPRTGYCFSGMDCYS